MRSEALFKKLHSWIRREPVASPLGIAISNIKIKWISESEATTTRLREFFADYLIQEPDWTPDVTINTQIWEARPELGWDPWELESAEFSIQDQTAVQRDFCALRQGKQIWALLSPQGDDAIHNLLRWVFADLLLDHHSFLMHGAGICYQGKGYLFFGKSGAGKSTSVKNITAIDPSVTLIGDDAVIVTCEPGKTPCLVSAPFGAGYSREAPKNIRAPLEGLFLLCQAERNQITPMTQPEASAALLSNAMVSGTHTGFARMLEISARLAERPRPAIQYLNLKNDSSFWHLIKNSEVC